MINTLMKSGLVSVFVVFAVAVSASAQSEGQKGEILGSAGFGAMALDVFNSMKEGKESDTSGGPNLAEVDSIAKSKLGVTYSEITSAQGRNTHAEAVRLVETVKSRAGGNLNSPMAQKWLQMFRAEYEKSLAKLKAMD